MKIKPSDAGALIEAAADGSLPQTAKVRVRLESVRAALLLVGQGRIHADVIEDVRRALDSAPDS